MQTRGMCKDCEKTLWIDIGPSLSNNFLRFIFRPCFD